MMFSIAAKQALTIARQDRAYRSLLRRYCRLAREHVGLRDEYRKVRADIELVLLLVPDRRVALELLGDRRDIAALDEVGDR